MTGHEKPARDFSSGKLKYRPPKFSFVLNSFVGSPLFNVPRGVFLHNPGSVKAEQVLVDIGIYSSSMRYYVTNFLD
jgi:hypothetical protein